MALVGEHQISGDRGRGISFSQASSPLVEPAHEPVAMRRHAHLTRKPSRVVLPAQPRLSSKIGNRADRVPEELFGRYDSDASGRRKRPLQLCQPPENTRGLHIPIRPCCPRGDEWRRSEAITQDVGIYAARGFARQSNSLVGDHRRDVQKLPGLNEVNTCSNPEGPATRNHGRKLTLCMKMGPQNRDIGSLPFTILGERAFAIQGIRPSLNRHLRSTVDEPSRSGRACQNRSDNRKPYPFSARPA